VSNTKEDNPPSMYVMVHPKVGGSEHAAAWLETSATFGCNMHEQHS
jgi:hypothetical protein